MTGRDARPADAGTEPDRPADAGTEPDRPADAGTAAERTALSWQRTALGVVATGALTVRCSVTEHFPILPGVALTAFGGIAGLFIVRQRYLRVLITVRTGRTPLSRYLIPATTAFMVVVEAGIAVGVASRF